MNDQRKTSLVLAGLTVLFLALALAFLCGPHGVSAVVARRGPPPGPVFTNTATVRLSVAELTKAGGDVSGLDCYACHKKEQPVAPRFDAAGKLIPSLAHRDVVFTRMNCAACHTPAEKVELKWDAEGHTIVPAVHTNDVARHGSTIGNDHCFNCHDPANLAELHTPGGKKLKLAESTLLCAGCHGPSYRDWNAGVHGRRNGFWDAKLGATERKDCTSCHDPHAPALPRMKPLPGPFRSTSAERRPPARRGDAGDLQRDSEDWGARPPRAFGDAPRVPVEVGRAVAMSGRRTFSYAPPFFARARKTAPEAGALPIVNLEFGLNHAVPEAGAPRAA